MYRLQTEASFDSAHFLAGYDGKCSNLHGHRWRILAEIEMDSLEESGQLRGMVVDFGDLKKDVKELADFYDHCFIYEEGTLNENTVKALQEEHFRMIAVPFRPTAEHFSKFFYDALTKKGYAMTRVTVYETPNNCATYSAE